MTKAHDRNSSKGERCDWARGVRTFQSTSAKKTWRHSRWRRGEVEASHITCDQKRVRSRVSSFSKAAPRVSLLSARLHLLKASQHSQRVPPSGGKAVKYESVGNIASFPHDKACYLHRTLNLHSSQDKFSAWIALRKEQPTAPVKSTPWSRKSREMLLCTPFQFEVT